MSEWEDISAMSKSGADLPYILPNVAEMMRDIRPINNQLKNGKKKHTKEREQTFTSQSGPRQEETVNDYDDSPLLRTVSEKYEMLRIPFQSVPLCYLNYSLDEQNDDERTMFHNERGVHITKELNPKLFPCLNDRKHQTHHNSKLSAYFLGQEQPVQIKDARKIETYKPEIDFMNENDIRKLVGDYAKHVNQITDLVTTSSETDTQFEYFEVDKLTLEQWRVILINAEKEHTDIKSCTVVKMLLQTIPYQQYACAVLLYTIPTSLVYIASKSKSEYKLYCETLKLAAQNAQIDHIDVDTYGKIMDIYTNLSHVSEDVQVNSLSQIFIR